MKNKLKKIVALLMAAVIALSSTAFALSVDDAQDEVQPRESAFFRYYSAVILPKGNGVYVVSFSVTANSIMDQLGATSIDIYKNGTKAYTLKYTTERRKGMMDYNTIVMADDERVQGTSGASYYAKIHYFAKNSTGSATRTYTTKTVVV